MVINSINPHDYNIYRQIIKININKKIKNKKNKFKAQLVKLGLELHQLKFHLLQRFLSMFF